MKRHRKHLKKTLFSLFLIVILAQAACGFFAPSPTPTVEATKPVATATDFPTPRPLPSLTQSSASADTAKAEPKPSDTAANTTTSTATATLVPLPTDTATPEPTATPRGFYLHSKAGFSFIAPASWSIQEETANYVTLSSSAAQIVFFASSQSGEEESIESVAETINSEWFPDQDTTLSDPMPVMLANGREAQAIDITVGEIVYRLVNCYNNFRSYLFVVVAPPDKLKKQQATLDEVFATVELFTPRPYGLDKNETLSLLGYDPDPQDVDPARSTSAASDYVGLLFSGLVRLMPTMQIAPDLAESWKVSPDGTVYTFTLRPGLKFASGKSLTAQDVKESWERAADPDTDSSTARTYLGDILGFNDKLDGLADEVSGIKVIDERTLEVTLDGAKPYFLAKLTYPTSFVHNVAQTEEDIDQWVWEADVSGPYKIKEYTKDEVFIFERNESYFEPPAIRYVVFIFHPGGSAISLYEEGTIDIVGLYGETVERVRKEDDPLHNQWLSTPSMCTGFVQMNNTMPPFDDLNVRKAFAQAVDRDIYIERITNNTSLPALTILPPSMPGFSTELSAFPYNPEEAKASLNASKYKGNLPEIKLSASGYGDQERDDLNALVSMWRETLGVEVVVEFLDPIKFTEAAHEQHGQMVSYGWCADYPDPENFLDVLYHTGSEFNVAGYSNPAVDALLEEARTTVDPAKRLQLYQQAEAMLLADAAAIPLDHNIMDVLVNPRIEGYVNAPMHAAYIQYLSIKP